MSGKRLIIIYKLNNINIKLPSLGHNLSSNKKKITIKFIIFFFFLFGCQNTIGALDLLSLYAYYVVSFFDLGCDRRICTCQCWPNPTLIVFLDFSYMYTYALSGCQCIHTHRIPNTNPMPNHKLIRWWHGHLLDRCRTPH